MKKPGSRLNSLTIVSCTWLLFGAAAGVFVHTLGIGKIEIGLFRVQVGNIAIGILPIVLILFGRTWRKVFVKIFFLISGIVATEYIYMIYTANGCFIDYYQYIVLASISVLVGLFLVIILGYMIHNNLNITNNASWPLKTRVFLVASMIFIFILFRLHHWYMISHGVPNENRSLLIFGLEIHHIALGSVAIFLFGVGITLKPKLLQSLAFCLLLGIAMGAIGDQVVYYALLKVSDLAYASVTSLVGGMAFVGLYSTIMLVG